MLITMKKYIPIFIVTLGLSFYLVSQGVFQSGDPTATPAKKSSKINKHYKETLPTTVFKTIDNKTISFKKMPKVVIVNFWASWCTPCLEEFPGLVKFQEKFQNSDVVIVGVNTDEGDQLKSIEKITKKYELNFPIVADKDGKFINDYLVTAIPVSIVYFNGEVEEVSQGAKDFMAEEFIERVEKVLK